MKKIHIVRHGETIWHSENRYAGHTDVELTAKGLGQGPSLVDWARTAKIDAVISSDLSRARLTAVPVCEALGLDLNICPDLREVNFGEGEGMTSNEMMEKFPSERSDFERRPASSPFPGGESGIQALTRAVPVVLDTMRNPNVDVALFIIHSTLARLLLCEFIGIDKNRYRSVFPKLQNGAINTVGFRSVTDLESLQSTGSLLALNAPAVPND